MSALDPARFQLTESLLSSVRREAGGSNWTAAPSFADLAQSFNTLLQDIGFSIPAPPAAAVKTEPLPVQHVRLAAACYAVQDPEIEDDFDWNTIV